METPVVSAAEMRAAEEAAFARGISAEALMDEAGRGVARMVRGFFPQGGRALVLAGKGNNGGDALVCAAHLKRAGWQVDVRLACDESESNALLRQKIAEFRDTPPQQTNENYGSLVLIDGLLGLGSKPTLREPILSLCREANRLRQEAGAFVFAVDQPTGLDADSGEIDPDCIRADFTATIGAAKRGLVADGALNVVGRLEVIRLEALTFSAGEETVATADSLRHLLPRRDFGAYKNQFGRIGLIAGSRGFSGAASLCAGGALRGGAGLVHLYVPEEIYPVVATAAPPEVMVAPFKFYAKLAEEPIDAWAIGPGLGQKHAAQVMRFLRDCEKPMVIDADALNLLSRRTEVLKDCRGPRLLTPHPGEMKRLGGDETKQTRAEIARSFTSKFPVTLLFKGSRTIVAEAGRLSYNTTGNPGMATGGMGDILTGVLAALLGQKLSAFDAARVGAWTCGRAAEIARFHGGASEQSLLPEDILRHLGAAVNDLQKVAS